MARQIENRSFGVALTKRDHSHGPAHAGITLLQYGDYECRESGRAYRIVKDVQRELGSEVRVVFRHFPQRDVHPRAQRAAEAAEAAAAQGRFWEMHDLLFDNQHALGDRHLREYASALGLEPLRFDCELAARAYAKRVRADILSASQLDVTSAPTLFINGIRYRGAAELSEIASNCTWRRD